MAISFADSLTPACPRRQRHKNAVFDQGGAIFLPVPHACCGLFLKRVGMAIRASGKSTRAQSRRIDSREDCLFGQTNCEALRAFLDRGGTQEPLLDPAWGRPFVAAGAHDYRVRGANAKSASGLRVTHPAQTDLLHCQPNLRGDHLSLPRFLSGFVAGRHCVWNSAPANLRIQASGWLYRLARSPALEQAGILRALRLL